jgi:hypothetical protein
VSDHGILGLRVVCAPLLALLCCGSCRSPSAPSAPAATVDVLGYLLGDGALWPRVGNHGQNQIVDSSRSEVCWTKYANPRRFECWRWDDRYVYHAVDHALDGDINDSYSFTDGRWMPRFVPIGATAASPWTLDVAQNRITWFDPSCQIDPVRSHIFPYRLRAWIEPRVDGGGSIGVRDTLMFEYEPYDPASPTPKERERYYFAQGAGWYRWERAGFVDLFNRLGGPATPMNRSVWCAAP